MNFPHFKLASVVLLLSVLIFSCTEKDFDSEAPNFNIDLFEDNIVNKLNGQVPGFAYAITYNKQLYSDSAVGFLDLENLTPFTTSSRMHVGSISKTVTAAAFLKLLQEDNTLSIENKALAFLPGYWEEGENIENLTFKNLLQHESGFNLETDNYFIHLQELIEGGLNEAEREVVSDYFNPNFGLFRLIIPMLNGNLNPNVTADDSLDFALSYMAYVNNNLFEPMGIDRAFCAKQSSDFVKYYSCSTLAKANGAGDQTFRCGAFGWHLSVLDLAAFNVHLRYNDDILSEETREIMDTEFLGWDNPHNSANGNYGTYLMHEGTWHYGSAGFETCIMKFPNQMVEVAVVYNCVDHVDGQIASPRKFLVKAYDDAWE